MKYLKFDAFDRFECIGGACPNTCCAGWTIHIDDESAGMYSRVEGPFGERLGSDILKSEDQYHFRLVENGRCAFLNEDNLCDIYCHLGQQALCHTCTQYPRYEWKLGDYCGVGLILSCPEVIRMIFDEKDDFAIYEYTDHDHCTHEEFRAENLCVEAMKISIGILKNTEISISLRLRLLIMFNLYYSEFSEAGEDVTELFDMFGDLSKCRDILEDLNSFPTNEIIWKFLLKTFCNVYPKNGNPDLIRLLEESTSAGQYCMSDEAVAKFMIGFLYKEYIDSYGKMTPYEMIEEVTLLLTLSRQLVKQYQGENWQEVLYLIFRVFAHSRSDLTGQLRRIVADMGMDLKVLLSIV